MARVIMTVVGVIALAAGSWLIVLWWAFVKAVLLACVALGLALLGGGMVIFGISEIAGALSRKSPPPPPTDPA